MPAGDLKRVVDANLWSVIHGSRIACEYLRRRGGALINVESEMPDQAAICSAANQAVKVWTDALRVDLERERAPIAVTLIQQAAMSEDVVEAILFAAATPVRDLFVAVKHPVLTGFATLGAGLALTAFFRGKKPAAATRDLSK
jgi:NAD(P)-dependent dehydrogenase (short-subunit alcohol dehydrogenase family)